MFLSVDPWVLSPGDSDPLSVDPWILTPGVAGAVSVGGSGLVPGQLGPRVVPVELVPEVPELQPAVGEQARRVVEVDGALRH